MLVADDHRIFRQSLRRVLEAEPNIKVIAEAEDGREAVRKTRELLPDVVLMDLSMLGMDGVEATIRIKKCCPLIRVVALTMYEDTGHLFDAIRAGARGYVTKGASSEELIRAIKAVFKGESLITPGLSKHVLEEFMRLSETVRGKPRYSPYGGLTPREIEVLKALSGGKANKQIARALGISEKTVKNHITNIYTKLEVNARTEAALKAVRMGLVEIE